MRFWAASNFSSSGLLRFSNQIFLGNGRGVFGFRNQLLNIFRGLFLAGFLLLVELQQAGLDGSLIGESLRHGVSSFFQRLLHLREQETCSR